MWGGYVDGLKVMEEIVEICNLKLGELVDSLNCFKEFVLYFEMF